MNVRNRYSNRILAKNLLAVVPVAKITGPHRSGVAMRTLKSNSGILELSDCQWFVFVRAGLFLTAG